MTDAMKKYIKALSLDPSKQHILVFNAQQFSTNDLQSIEYEDLGSNVAPIFLVSDGDVRSAVAAYEIGKRRNDVQTKV